MAQLPADRTKLALAQGNQIPSTVASSTKNIQAMTEAYDTIDALYNFTTSLISAGTLSRLGVINVRDYNASGSAQTTTGSITSGTNRVALASIIDFVVGQGIWLEGIHEVASLEVTNGASSSANCTITLNGTGKTVALTSGNTATQVATAIRGTTFPGWTTGGSGTTVTFTSNTSGTKTDASYSAGTTGATGTMTTTTQGSADIVSTISAITNNVATIGATASVNLANVNVRHDDGAALTAALSADGDVYIPSGTYRISSTITVTTGSAKRVIGASGAILSISIPADTNVFDLSVNVGFENITFDFNNGYVKNGLLFREDLGVIRLRKLRFQNVKDIDSTYSTSLGFVSLSGNQLDIDDLDFENILKMGNGVVSDSGGSLQGLQIAKLDTDSGIQGTIKNVKVVDFHNINASDAIIYEDTAGIYVITPSSDSANDIYIENIYGFNFGKRLLKIHASNVEINTAYGYSDTNDALSVIGVLSGEGMGNKTNISARNITCLGKMSTALHTSANDVIFRDYYIDTQKPSMSGNDNNAFGVSVTGDNTLVDGGYIQCERCILINKQSGDPVKSLTIANSIFSLPSFGAIGVHVAFGSVGFVGLTVDNNTMYNNSTETYSAIIDTHYLDGTTGKTGKDLSVRALKLYSNAPINNYGIYLKYVDGVNIDDYQYNNDSGTKHFRGILMENCTRVNVTKANILGAFQTAIRIDNCTGVAIDGLETNSSDNTVSNTSSTGVLIRDFDKSKVSLNDATAITGTLFEQEYSSGSTANRPTASAAGQQYFDTSLKKPIWWDAAASAWVQMGRYVSVPATASATGIAGDWAADSSYLYVCRTANTWMRVAIATW